MAKKDNKPIKKNICVLFGGVSPEHDVSLRSAQTVLDNIDTDKYRVFPVGIRRDGRWMLHQGENWELGEGIWELNPGNSPAVLSPDGSYGLLLMSSKGYKMQRLDCVFPMLHGKNGEDGSIQGLLQLAGIPCVGCGMEASVVGMNKYLTKLVVKELGIRQAKFVHLTRHDKKETWAELAENLPFAYPVFVKPCTAGSSVGVSKVKRAADLPKAIETALKYSPDILIEEGINGREIETAVLGGKKPTVSCCGEIVANAEFYDYDTKYITDTSEAHVPADISEEKSEEIRKYALEIFKALGCTGMSRIDFFLSDSGEVVFNEINTIPGFTSISMYPKLFEHGGISTTELIDKLIKTAMGEKSNG